MLATLSSEKSGPAPGGLEHVHEDEMLAGDQFAGLGEALGEHRIVERGEEDEQRALAQPQPDEGAQFLEIRRHALRMERVEPVAAGVVMRLAALRADEAEHAVAESDQAELIALLLRRETEDERRGDEALQRRRRAIRLHRRVPRAP